MKKPKIKNGPLKPITKKQLFLVCNFLLIALIIFGGNMYINKSIENLSVAVYTSDLESGTVIKAGNVKFVEIPASKFEKDIPRTKSELIGMVLNTKVYGNTIAYNAQLDSKKNASIFNKIDLAKYRKVSLPVNYLNSVGGVLKQGDFVDLLYTGETDTGTEKGNYTKAFLQNVLVYQLYDDEGNIMGSSAQAAVNSSQAPEPAIIVLAVPLDQAEEIIARATTGTVSFVGRFDDSESYVTVGYVLKGGSQIFSGSSPMETDTNKINTYDVQNKSVITIEE